MGKLPTQKMFVEEDDEAQEVQPKTEYKPDTVALPEGNVIDLPSMGKLWTPSSISYRDILVKDEETLALATQDNYIRTLNGVLKTVACDFEDFDKMTLHDRDFFLMYLWCTNYDAIKTVEFKCDHCGHKHLDYKVDLTKVPVDNIRDDIKCPFELVLKKTGKPIKIRLNIVGDEAKAEEFIANNPDHRYEHVMMVCSIDLGVAMPLDKKVDWVSENVTAKERGLIKKYHSYYKFGIKKVVDLTCVKCKGVTQGELPFRTQDILFPTVSGDFEELL